MRWRHAASSPILRGSRSCTIAISIALALWCAVCTAAEPVALTPAEANGKLIYATGRGAAGRQLRFRLLSAGDGLIPATGIYCVNCHGKDGSGGREGEISLADIRYDVLRRPLEPSPKWQRARAPYTTDPLLARAITQGIDASGNLLAAAMPRWDLSPTEMRDLLAYLKRLKRTPATH